MITFGGSGLPITTSPQVLANDDIVVQYGDDGDGAMVLRSTTLNANTALTDVLVGTPVTGATPANSVIISNITNDGDIVFAATTGGNSSEFIRLDGSNNTCDFSKAILLLGDNLKLHLGASNDSSIYYDGTDLIFDSQEVGSGNFVFKNGRIYANAGTEAMPTYSFEADVDVGMRLFGVGRMAFTIAASDVIFIESDGLKAINSTGFAILNEAASSTNPTLVPSQSDLDTGVGWESSNIIHFIAGGTSRLKIEASQLLTTVNLNMGNKNVSQVDNGMFGGATSVGTSAAGVITIANGTPPSTDVVNQFQMWSEDINGAGTAGMVVRSEDGTKYEFGEFFDIEGYGVIGGSTTADADVTFRVKRDFTASSGSHGLQFLLNGGTITSDATSNTTIANQWIQTMTITDGGGTITNVASLYIQDAPTYSGTVTNGPYALFVDAGKSRFDGDFEHKGTNFGVYSTTPVAQPTTGVAEATFVENSGGTAVNVDSTFGGYTLQQIAQALQNLGLLA